MAALDALAATALPNQTPPARSLSITKIVAEIVEIAVCACIGHCLDRELNVMTFPVSIRVSPLLPMRPESAAVKFSTELSGDPWRVRLNGGRLSSQVSNVCARRRAATPLCARGPMREAQND